MNGQPDFPADEHLLPAADCTCSSCAQLRTELAAAALLALVEVSAKVFATNAANQATGAGRGRENIHGNPTVLGAQARFYNSADQNHESRF